MNVGDIVYIDYVAKIKETGEIVDITNEKKAKEIGIFNEKIKYEPLPVIIGKGFLIPGLEEELLKMNVGEEKIIEIPPEKAFGLRDENLVKIFKVSDFEKQNIKPEVGKFVKIGNFKGKIISVSGGRVLVDFNNPLAGKTLIYELKIVKKAEKDLEKVIAILKMLTGKEFEIKEENNEIKIFENELVSEQKNYIANLIFELTNYKAVYFITKIEKK